MLKLSTLVIGLIVSELSAVAWGQAPAFKLCQTYEAWGMIEKKAEGVYLKTWLYEDAPVAILLDGDARAGVERLNQIWIRAKVQIVEIKGEPSVVKGRLTSGFVVAPPPSLGAGQRLKPVASDPKIKCPVL